MTAPSWHGARGAEAPPLRGAEAPPLRGAESPPLRGAESPPLRGAESLRVNGVVQGVGFRPFVYRLAIELGLAGSVSNDSDGVHIELIGSAQRRDRFVQRLRSEAPPLSRIDAVDRSPRPLSPSDPVAGFQILASGHDGAVATIVPPDTAVCDDCLAEMADPHDRRFGHPFITCTNCGPRFTIVTGLPYDRSRTTMAFFAMCELCRAEYEDPASRRFHAQPIGCQECGPTLTVRCGPNPTSPDSVAVVDRRAAAADVIATAAGLISSGAVVAVKGIGGYHLVADASNAAAVQTIRDRKHRPDKPFAVMARDLDAARRIGVIGDRHADLLTSPARPIVLVTSRRSQLIATPVAPNNPMIGVLLPYTPLHHLWFARLATEALVMTSANRSGEPLLYRDDPETLTALSQMADAIVTHDREIRVPCDDSVMRIVADRLLPVRVGRGYAPVVVPRPAPGPAILAAGGELKNTVALATADQIWVSPHIGDMGNLETLRAFERSSELVTTLTGTVPTVIAHDDHPAYLTTRWARDRRDGCATIGIQHHVAHVASVCAENGLDPDTPVIGLAFDGTGYGADGTIWGGEILWRHLGDDGATVWDRVGHLTPIDLPGGDAAVTHPWRAALAHLQAAGIPWDADLAPVAAVAEAERRLFDRQLARGFGVTRTSSMGRLFDAIASLLDLHHDITYEAQAAIALEHLATQARDADVPEYELTLSAGSPVELDPAPLLGSIVADWRRGVDPASIAAGAHRALARSAMQVATGLGAERDVTTFALSGGVFQNAFFTELCLGAAPLGATVVTHQVLPPNDGGLALGQAVEASRILTYEQSDRGSTCA